MNLPEGVDARRFAALVQLARDEDLGTSGDITTALLPEPMQHAKDTWELRSRAAGWFCGGSLISPLLEHLAPLVRLDTVMVADEAGDVQPGSTIARLGGSVVQMLSAERIVLNFLQRMSGVATLTQQFVRRVAGTHAKILDTRKTLPGWRDLDRYAVRCGGGHNHRHGLHDAVLLKDNHLAGVTVDRLAHAVFEMLGRLSHSPQPPQFVEVEVDSIEQATELFKVVGIDVILLDNFTPQEAARAVALRDEAGLRGKVELEASGGITLDTIADFAAAGVERIAVGAITHSAVALDLGLDAAED